ncbi:hypothetical protein BpHYR1_029852 [Brachionus plicatilis]|uniref:Uncharacterized protein n=1 Tax=Brachionus plicatilis TaxID=10195 RepID=A0A3M7QIK1_BRAPC|nr:hypothetical protein BpHYR1_029852 [Brachionus plicatilis]
MLKMHRSFISFTKERCISRKWQKEHIGLVYIDVEKKIFFLDLSDELSQSIESDEEIDEDNLTDLDAADIDLGDKLSMIFLHTDRSLIKKKSVLNYLTYNHQAYYCVTVIDIVEKKQWWLINYQLNF